MKIMDLELISVVEQGEEGYFSWKGCENIDCESHGQGNTVVDCEGFRNLAEAQGGRDNMYQFSICFNCLYEHEYGERPE